MPKELDSQVQSLIDDFVDGMDDDDYCEALELIIDHAQTMLDAKREEMGE